MKILADPTIPVNAGMSYDPTSAFRPAPFLDAQRPAAPVCARNTETTHRVADTVHQRHSRRSRQSAIPAASQWHDDSHHIGGRDPRNGQFYTYIETIAGRQGGRACWAMDRTASM